MRITKIDCLAGQVFCFWIERVQADPGPLSPIILPIKWLAFLRDLGSSAYVRGPRVRTARALEDRGLVTIRDDGDLKINGRTDGERWYVEPTELGRVISNYVV